MRRNSPHWAVAGRGFVALQGVQPERRERIRANHSATHLLHYALRRVLGEQAQQKGSLVEPDRLRFDFTSARGLTADERAKVEDLVNEKVLVNAPIETEVLPIDLAKQRGALPRKSTTWWGQSARVTAGP